MGAQRAAWEAALEARRAAAITSPALTTADLKSRISWCPCSPRCLATSADEIGNDTCTPEAHRHIRSVFLSESDLVSDAKRVLHQRAEEDKRVDLVLAGFEGLGRVHFPSC